MSRVIIVGPPGTGKTTRLRQYAEEEFKRGLQPDELQAHTFTRTARRKLLKAFYEKFRYKPKDLPWVKTIHSCCYHLLGGKSVLEDLIVDYHKLKEFEKQFGYEISASEARSEEEEEEMVELMLQTIDDWYLFFHNWWRNCLYPSWEEGLFHFTRQQQLPEEWAFSGLVKFIERYEKWKNEHGYYDYTDLLLEVLRRRLAPDVRVLLVDESQDLSPLQFKVVQMWEEGVERSYFAGDHAQAIFSFNGANPDLFLNLKGKLDYLRQSWRVPREPHRIAMEIIKRGGRFYKEPWLPKDAEGWARKLFPETLPLEQWVKEEKEVFLLHRTRYLTNEFADYLLKEGIPFSSMRGKWCPWETNEGRVVWIMRKLLEGAEISIEELNQMVKKYITKPFLKHGAKADIERRCEDNPKLVLDKSKLSEFGFTDAFFSLFNKREFLEIPRLSSEEKNFFKVSLRKFGWELLEKYTVREIEKTAPKLYNGTIHSSKGEECDITVVNTSLTKRTLDALYDNPEEEYRTFYVATTRCREGAVILITDARRSFPF